MTRFGSTRAFVCIPVRAAQCHRGLSGRKPSRIMHDHERSAREIGWRGVKISLASQVRGAKALRPTTASGAVCAHWTGMAWQRPNKMGTTSGDLLDTFPVLAGQGLGAKLGANDRRQ